MHNFSLDIHAETAPVQRHWEMIVGSCHAATALREDYRAQLRQCRRDLGFRYVRFHGLFNDDMSVARKHLLSGKVILSFTNVDSIFDFLLSIGMKPFVELGFMPSCFASGDQCIFHYKGNVTPPADYAQWAWFIREFTAHLIERYGRDEVRQWYFEVWNEPNLCNETGMAGSSFWAGDMLEYFKLYQTTAQAIKSVDPTLPVGGPATSNNAWIPELLQFCRENNAPIDFVTTHHYPTDVVLGYGVEDSHNFVERLRKTDRADTAALQALAAEYTVFQQHLWEGVERGVVTEMARRAAAEAQGLPLFYTEWSSLAGLPSDGPFGASFIAKTVMDNRGIVDGYAYWTFSDLFEESGMPGVAFHGGFGLMTIDGIPKAPYRAFQLLHMLGGEAYTRTYAQGTVDIYPFYKRESRALQLLAVNHHSLLHEIAPEDIAIGITGLGNVSNIHVELFRVDDSHANAIAAWEAMGRPSQLTQGQIDSLKGASALTRETMTLAVQKGTAELSLTLPPMGTALVTFYLEDPR